MIPTSQPPGQEPGLPELHAKADALLQKMDHLGQTMIAQAAQAGAAAGAAAGAKAARAPAMWWGGTTAATLLLSWELIKAKWGW